MKIRIQNIGVVKEADIHLNGLTVICGENDTGKSTISKSLFALIKGINGFEEEYQESFYYELISNIRQINRLVRVLDYDNLTKDELKFVKTFNSPVLMQFRSIREKNGLEQYLNQLNSLKKLIDSLHANNKLESFTVTQFGYYINEIQKIVYQNNNFDEKRKLAFEQAFFSEFQSLIQGKSSIGFEIDEGSKNNKLEIKFNSKGKISNKLSNLDPIFGDVTYIETPAVIQFFSLIMGARVKLSESMNSVETVPLHTKDLTRKLFNSNNHKISELFNHIHEIICHEIHGQFTYNKDKKDFILTRDSAEIPSMDIASGIKSLGIIDILVRNNILNPNGILILDEPEVNLHPEWQNKYAEIICGLVRLGIIVLVVTHSPYMVSALHHYSKDDNLINRNFYLSEKQDNFSVFSDKTENIMGGIVKKFALALEGMY